MSKQIAILYISKAVPGVSDGFQTRHGRDLLGGRMDGKRMNERPRTMLTHLRLSEMDAARYA